METTNRHGPNSFYIQLLVLNDVHKSLPISLNPTLQCPILSCGTYPRQSLCIGSLLRLLPLLLLLTFDRALHSIALELLDEFVLNLAGLKLLQPLLKHIRILEHVLHDLLDCRLQLLNNCLLSHEVLAHRVQLQEVAHFLFLIIQVEVIMQDWRGRWRDIPKRFFSVCNVFEYI